jgi:hypothetical protein
MGQAYICRRGGGAKLTGNATPADVRAGATFYSNDAKAKLTGTAEIFKMETGSVNVVNTNTQYPVSLPNIDKCFMIIVSLYSDSLGQGRAMLKFNGTWMSIGVGGSTSNTPTVTITETGFNIANKSLSGYTHYWYAYEALT